MSLYPSGSLFPDPTVFPGAVLFPGLQTIWRFSTPTQEVYVRLAGRGLIGSYQQGLTVYRVDGQWRTKLSPGFDELSRADRSYAGGYLHTLTDDQRDELIAGGFGDYIASLSVASPPNAVGFARVGTATVS